MRMRITWRLSVKDSLQEYTTDFVGYSCLVQQGLEGAGWSWAIAPLPNQPELTSGEAPTLAKAMLAAVKELKKITRHIARDLKTLHSAKTVDMKVVPLHDGAGPN